MPFTVIGEDGGYIQSPVTTTTITMAPGERYDVLVNFPVAAVGTSILLTNTANAPFPVGLPADPLTTGQIMQFTVKATADATAETRGVTTIATLPGLLNPTLTPPAVGATFPTLAPAPTANRRIITLTEVMGAKGPVMVLINGQYYNAPATETPTEGTTEEWVIVNLTADTHPIHLHLVTFQLVTRQLFDAKKYTNDWIKQQVDPLTKTKYSPPFPRLYIPSTLDPALYLLGTPVTPTPTEMTWKDTLQMHPGEVTTIRVRFTQQDGNVFPFEASDGPGYVWHCHIIDHEDNEMMRPLQIVAP
jgi:FtsP/CotA-like multicopper oxidase with cupredoxin domain